MKQFFLNTLQKYGYEITKIDQKENHISKKNSILKYLITSENVLIFDVGAHKGESVKAFKHLFSNSIIHAFEPDPDSFKELENNSSIYKGVFLNNAGLSNEIGEKTFYKHAYSKLNSLNKINIKGNTMHQFLEGKDIDERSKLSSLYNRDIQVDITTLDTYCSKNNINHIDILKIDTQGHERECLEGAENTLDKVKVIYTEINFFDMYEVKYNFFDLESILIPKGFSLYAIPRLNNEKTSDKIGWVEAIYYNTNLIKNL